MELQFLYQKYTNCFHYLKISLPSLIALKMFETARMRVIRYYIKKMYTLLYKIIIESSVVTSSSSCLSRDIACDLNLKFSQNITVYK